MIKKINSTVVIVFVLVISMVYIIGNDHMQKTVSELFIYDELKPRKAGEFSTAFLTIPSNTSLGDSVGIRTAHQEVFIYSNGRLIYEYKKDFHDIYGKSAVSQWHILPLNPDIDSNILEMVFYSPYDFMSDFENTVLIGNHTRVIEFIIENSVPTILISICSVISGIGTLFWYYFYKNRRTAMNFSYFGAFLIIIGIWIFSKSKRIFFEFIPSHIERQIGVYAIFIAPIFLLFAIAENYSGNSKKIIRGFGYALAINAVVVLILQVFTIADLAETIGQMFFILGLGMATVLILKFKRIRDENTYESRRNLGFLIFMTVFLFLEIINFLRAQYNEVSFYISYILVVAALLALFDFVNGMFVRDREFAEVKENLELSRINIVALKMKPHLVSNTLLSIQELCYKEPSEAVDAIGSFSKYLRSTFNISLDENLIPFSKELQYIREYVNIIKICYGENIEFIEEIGKTRFLIPPLSLQPLIENAVIHGIRKRPGARIVKLITEEVNGDIVITIYDDGAGFDVNEILDPRKDKVRGIKTSSGHIIYRLENLLGAKVMISSAINIGTTISITIPENY